MSRKDDFSFETPRERSYEPSRASGVLDFLKKNILKGLTGITLIAGVFGYSTCTKYVKPDELGVMQVNFSPLGLLGKEGIRKEIYESGVHLEIPGIQKIHTFPKDLQVLDMHTDEKIKSRLTDMRQIPPAHIQTADGFFIDLDVSIIYHIKDPYELITKIGAGRLYEDSGIIPKAEPALKETLGRLEPEDFYNSEKRSIEQDKARDSLNALLEGKGISVDHVLVRWPAYNTQVQERIEGRNLQHQLELKNTAETSESEAKSELIKITEEGTAAMRVAEQQGSVYVIKKQAEIELYERKKKAEADLLVKTAEAERTKLKNEAYRGTGAELLVGRKMAEVFEGLDSIVVTAGGKDGFNPLDLESLMRSFNSSTNSGVLK